MGANVRNTQSTKNAGTPHLACNKLNVTVRTGVGGGRVKKSWYRRTAFFWGVPPEEEGGRKKNWRENFFPTPKPEIFLSRPPMFGFGRCKEVQRWGQRVNNFFGKGLQVRQLVGGGGILTGGGGCLWARDGQNRCPVPDVWLPVGAQKIGIKIPSHTPQGNQLASARGFEKEGGDLKVPKGSDEVDVGGGANIHQAGGHNGYMLGVIVDGAFVGAWIFQPIWVVFVFKGTKTPGLFRL